MSVLLTFLRRINDAVWDEKFWLPVNMTWNEISPPSNEQFNYTSGSDLILAIPVAVLFLAIRYPLERWCFRPLGVYLGINSKPHKKIPPMAVLETAYVSNVVVEHEQIVCLSKQLDWTERQVERWLRLRRANDKPTTLVKFTESFWRFFYYTCSFIFGGFCVWDKPWAWDPSKLLADRPYSISDDCWWYCVFSCGFYCSLMFSQLSDVKRKDFMEMMIHHFVAIVLVTFTWVVNTHRFMVLGFFMFDMSDVILELVKMAKYAKFRNTTIVLFCLMTLTWLATRWVWYPFWILRVTLVDCLLMFGMCPIYLVLNGLLLSIGVLNAVWTYFILQAWYTGLVTGQAADSRSSDEGDSSEDLEPSKKGQLTSRGSSINLQLKETTDKKGN